MPSQHTSLLRAYAHLYLPLLASFLAVVLLPAPTAQQVPLFAILALPTYLVGSYVHQPLPPSLDHSTRLSHKHLAIRVAILFTYGRIYGTSFDLGFFVADVIFNELAGWLLGERKPKRRSEFLYHALWTLPSSILLGMGLVTPDLDILYFCVGTVDRTMYRATFVALVDDIFAALAYPNVRTKKGKAILIGAQGLTITLLVAWGFSGGVERFARSLNTGRRNQA